nr:uncharacterized protein CI109_006124 [Kwoniella shandongensis]KAA5525551.1 hypothetical protein CI109_006124 [Kwoniella shandongensis]
MISSRQQLPLLPLALIVISSLPSLIEAAQFYFRWQTNTHACQVVNLNWSLGVPPFQVWIVPIFGQSFIYNIPAWAYVDGYGTYPISLQLDEGQDYTVVMSDANGLGTGGSSEIQRVQPSNDTTCLDTASYNSTSLDFTFTVSGQAVQCERGFETSWTGGKEDGPYNFTVVPLDQGFNAYDVPLEEGVTSQSSWQLNMTAGSRFTILMSSGNGYGRGGVAGVYQVGSSGNTSCISQGQQGTGIWPSNITIMTLPSATLTITESAARSNSSSLSAGAIAGVVIGVLVAIALVVVILLWLLRRHRNRRNPRIVKQATKHSSSLDLVDDRRSNNHQPMIEPYRPVGSFQPHDTSDTTMHELDSFDAGEISTSSSAGFAGMGAGVGQSAWNDNRISPVDESGREGEPGVAGPLPLKTLTSRSPSAQPSQSPFVDSPTRSASEREPTNSMANELKRTPDGSVPGRMGSPLHPLGMGQREPINGGGGGGGMRVINHDNSESMPALPPSATQSRATTLSATNNSRRRIQQQDVAGPTFRRHADAGRVQEEVVDLPPLYSEVPRDGPVPGREGDQDSGDAGR